MLSYESLPKPGLSDFERGVRSGQLWFLLFWLISLLIFISMGILFPLWFVVFGFAYRACKLTGWRSVYAWITIVLCGLILLWIVAGLLYLALEWIYGRA